MEKAVILSMSTSASREREISELNEKIRMLKLFINQAEAGIYVIDYRSGEVLFANQKITDLSGNSTTPEQLVGHICWKLVNVGGEGRCPFCPYEKLVDTDGNPTKPYVWEQLFPQYGNRWLKIISEVIYWVDGRLAQMNTYFDITETKAMQERLLEYARESESQKRQSDLQEILDRMPIPVRIVDHQSAEIVYANNEALKLFEPEKLSGIIGRSIFDYLPVKQSNGNSSDTIVRKLFSADDSLSMDIEYLTGSERTIEARITACSIDFNGRKSSLGIIVDLAAEKAHDRMLQNAADKEREANQLKSSFLSNMSHEIRTPMNAIIGLTEIELSKKTPTESLDVFRKINISAKNLLQVVNDILDMSKIEANKIDLFPGEFELDEVLDSVLMIASPRLAGKPVELLLDASSDLPRYLMGDKTRLWQILKNCLDNAAKYTQEGSIALRVAEDKVRSTDDIVFISFAVADTGLGMDDQQIQKAFMPYEQVYSDMQKRYAGTGLGLPISKQLCELMGGTMGIESSLNRGTTIFLTIPFGRIACDSTPDDDPTALSDLRILAVDNNALTLEIIRRILENNGANYTLAYGGAEALDLIRERKGKRPPFDVILLDYLMEDINGLEAAKQIHNELSPTSKIMLVTAYGYQLEEAEFEACGVTGIIEKPFSPLSFIQKIRAAAGLVKHNNDGFVRAYTQFSDVRVLVCEDNDINQEVAVSVLEHFGVTAVPANNGFHGLEILENDGPFDLILMDLHMPVMDGFEATRAIRNNPRHKNLPIISLTADAMTDAVHKCLEAGMSDYLAKPFEMSDFHDILVKWLPESKRMQ